MELTEIKSQIQAIQKELSDAVALLESPSTEVKEEAKKKVHDLSSQLAELSKMLP